VNQRQVLLVQVRPAPKPVRLIRLRLRQLLLLRLVPVERQGRQQVLRPRLHNLQQVQIVPP